MSVAFEWWYVVIGPIPDRNVDQRIRKVLDHFNVGSVETDAEESDQFPATHKYRFYNSYGEESRVSLTKQLVDVLPAGVSIRWLGNRVESSHVEESMTTGAASHA